MPLRSSPFPSCLGKAVKISKVVEVNENEPVSEEQTVLQLWKLAREVRECENYLWGYTGVGGINVAICIMIKDECNSSEMVNNGSHMQLGLGKHL